MLITSKLPPTNSNLYVCCFTLDLTVNFFGTYPMWWTIACGFTLATVAIEPLAQRWVGRYRRAYLVAAGLAVAVLTHQTLFFLSDLEMYGLGAVGLVLIGFGVLIFIPAILIVALSIHLVRYHFVGLRRRCFFGSLAAPALVTLVLATAYLFQLRTLRELATTGSDLPVTVHLLQYVDPGFPTKVALLGSAVYQSEASESWQRNRLLHYPLAFWLLLCGEVDDTGQTLDRRRLVQFFENSSHRTEEQLWSGTEVRTPLVDVRHVVHASTRTVRSRYDLVATADVTQWSQNEAIYTLHLPPGATVTNSSLWVNGVEQPGRLTTKARAEQAYRAVVGQERRDPMLVQWRDGQTVSLRVFPIYTDLPRAFSVEVLSPLGTTGADYAKGPGHLSIRPVHIEGPGLTWARSASDVLVDDADASAALFNAMSTEALAPQPRRFGYREHTHVLHDNDLAVTDSQPSFVHSGTRYTLERAKPVVFAPAASAVDAANAVYVDLTEGWTEADLYAIAEAADQLPVYVWRADAEGKNAWERLTGKHAFEGAAAFAKTRPRSFVPVYDLPSPRGALLVTRDQEQPFALEVIGSVEVKRRLDDFTCELRPRANLSVFHVGDAAPPYLASLAEIGAVTLELGDLSTLTQRLRTGERRVSADGPGVVEFEGGHRRIVASPTHLPDSDGDPALMQLFAARQAMLASQTGELSADQQQERIDIAQTANIVSPFSSLIVLENDADYARFGIDNRVGIHRKTPPTQGLPLVVAPTVVTPEPQLLDQVFADGSGSVPEPEEWALIFLGLLTVGFIVRCRRPA